MCLDFEQEQELSEELLLEEEEEEEAGDGTWMHLHSTEVESDDEESDDEDDELSMDLESQCAFSPQRCCTLTLCQPSAFCSPLVCTTSPDDELEEDPDQEWCESLELDDEELSSCDDDELLLLEEGRQEQSSLACATATHKATQITSANFILMAAKINIKVFCLSRAPKLWSIHLLLV